MANLQEVLNSRLVEDKLDVIRKIFVKHTKAQEARDMLQLSLEFARRLRETSSTYLIGWSRCGKSEIIKRLIQQTGVPVSGEKVQCLEGNGKRFLYADLMGGSTPRLLSRQLNFEIFNDRTSLRKGENESTSALIKNLNACGFDGFILDEAQNLAENGVRKLARFILSIENGCSTPLFVFGPPSLAKMISNVDAMSQRAGGIKMLTPFGFANDEQRENLAAFVEAFSDQLPFDSNWFSENEGDHHMLRATFYAQWGRPGRHSLLVETPCLTRSSGPGGSEPAELTKEDIAPGFSRVFMDQEIMRGKNPFCAEDYLRLPNFPLSVADEKALD